MLKMAKGINMALGEGRRSETELEGIFNDKWPELEAEVEKATGESAMEPRVIRISELAREAAIIAGRVFEDVIIRGPVILLVLEGCSFIHCSFGKPPGETMDSLIWKPKGSVSVGAIGVSRVRFERCSFEGVGFAGPEELLAILRSVPQGEGS